MKTIVFHSYKGGVGRSLALANLAFALTKMKKKVVVLDLDIDAPGLHSKFGLSPGLMDGWEHRVKGGYIDYLAYYFGLQDEMISDSDKTIVDHKPLAATPEARCDHLNDSFLIDIPGMDLKFIPAGKYDQKYWWNLASPWFNELFSISRNEYSPDGTIRLHQKREFLKDEKEVIRQLFKGGTDYFLVDCKSAREYSSVPLYYWADIIVSMFPANDEGVNGAARIHQFVWSVRKDEVPGPKIVPVACRLPGDVDYSSWKEKYYDRLSEYFEQYYLDTKEIQASIVTRTNFVRLREHRLLEHSEKILTSDHVIEPENHWYHGLKLDYVELYASIFDDSDKAELNDPDDKKVLLKLNHKADWMTVLQMPGRRSVDDGSFQIKPDHGIVENKDAQRNVLLRASTLRILINNMANAMPSDETREKTLVEVGRNIGSSFGLEFAESGKFFEAETPLKEKLKKWCEYDSQNAGFGVLTFTYNELEKEIVMNWHDNFFDDKVRDKSTIDSRFGYWLGQGYLEGVIKELVSFTDNQTLTAVHSFGTPDPETMKSTSRSSMEFRFRLLPAEIWPPN